MEYKCTLHGKVPVASIWLSVSWDSPYGPTTVGTGSCTLTPPNVRVECFPDSSLVADEMSCHFFQQSALGHRRWMFFMFLFLHTYCAVKNKFEQNTEELVRNKFCLDAPASSVVDPDPDPLHFFGNLDPHPHQIKIRIRIKVTSWIRIRIRINLQMTSQSVWNMSIFEHFFKGLGPVPDPHQGEKSAPDPHPHSIDNEFYMTCE